MLHQIDPRANVSLKGARCIAFHATVFLAAFLIVISRRPDAVFNPQFFAEDGTRWYSDAYHFGLHSLLMPEAGYLHTLTRLIALWTLLFPFSLAPLIMNVCAMVVQVLPVNVILSRRFFSIPLRARLLASFLYLALPNTHEIDANITTIQWHLALLACLVLLARPAADSAWRVFHAIVLMLISIESPMGILLLPTVAVLWWRRRKIWPGPVALLVAGAFVQAIIVLLSHSRSLQPNGATLTRLTSILGRQVFISSLLGTKTAYRLAHMHSSYVIELTAMLAGMSITMYALWHAPTEVKLFIGFAIAAVAAALARPLANPVGPQWEFLRIPGCGTRYYFLPMLAFLASLLWTVGSIESHQKIRYFAGVLLLLLPIGIYRDWRYPAFVDFHFREYALEFEQAPSGTTITIPINPNWSMRLTKH